MDKKPWKNRWKIIDSLSAGGQGSTLLVQEKGSNNQVFVLKLLNNQKDPERRKRMRIEVITNESIDHPGVPRVIDSNVEDYRVLETKLFCVFEYIEGGTLNENLLERSLSLEDALEFTLKLIEIVIHCHNLGVVHRDIKPDNIILKASDLKQPFLIDFGLTFNKELDIHGDKLTSANQQLGNRFLLLPELRGTESNKRDPRSDITSIVGILFYVLTNQYPTNLADENSSKPHQRKEAKSVLSVIPGEKLTRLNRIFDIGFNVSINDRYQSLISLKSDLESLRQAQKSPSDLNDKLEAIRNISPHDKVVSANRFENSSKDVSSKLRTTIHSIHNELGDFSIHQTGYNVDYRSIEYRDTYILKYKIDSSIEARLNFKLYTNGSEEIFEVKVATETTELGRRPFDGVFNWINIKDKIRELAIEEIYKNSN